MKNKVNVEYVLHDGKLIPIEDLVFMAKSSGVYIIAEHYIVSIFAHIFSENKPELIAYVNEIREHYEFSKYKTPHGTPASGSNMPKKDKEWDEVRTKYQKLSESERVACLKESLSLLITNNATLFVNKSCWSGIYLVIRDRLQGRLTASGFYEFALKITPSNWPATKAIKKTTMSNMSHSLEYEDYDQAYYDMKNNPWKELCGVYETIVMQVFLTR